MNWLRYHPAMRRGLIHVCNFLPHGRLRGKVLDFLYPLDCTIRFK